MTDNEIIKALECCSTNNQKCRERPLYLDCMAGVPSKNISRKAFSLIKRQQERMDRIVEQLEELREATEYGVCPDGECLNRCEKHYMERAIAIVKGVQNE